MKKILAATDFSPSSKAAVNYAAQLAQATSAQLILLHATHIPVVSDTFVDLGLTLDSLEKADRESMQKLHDSLKNKYPDLRIEKKVKIGFAAELIHQLVLKADVSLVVMGISHLDKFSEVVFGSTSTAVAGTVNCPVLIIPDKTRYKQWKKIAFAFDQKNLPTGTGVRVLKELRDMNSASMQYVNVLDSDFPEKDTTSLKPVVKIFRDINPDIHFLENTRGKTVETLQDWTKRNKSNALVMVARKHNIFWKMFNESTTKKMAFHTNIPLLVLSESKKH